MCILVAFAGPLQAQKPPGRAKTAAAGPAKKPAAPTSADTTKRMQRTVRNFEFSGTFLGALKRIAIAGRVRFSVDWHALRGVDVRKETKVSFKAGSARVEQLLDMVMVRAAGKGKPLGWYVSGPLVYVTTQRHVLARSRRIAVAGVTSRRGAVRSIHFENAPLTDVIEFFRDLTGANFHVNWKALAQLGVTRESPVGLKVHSVPVARALDLIVEQLTNTEDKRERVYWVIDEGVVMVSTGAALDVKLRTRVYNIGDLMAQSAPAPVRMSMAGPGNRNRNNTRSSSDRSTLSSAEADTKANNTMKETLIEIIRNSIGEDMWEPSGRGSVRIVRGQLIITQSLLGFKLLGQSLRKR